VFEILANDQAGEVGKSRIERVVELVVIRIYTGHPVSCWVQRSISRVGYRDPSLTLRRTRGCSGWQRSAQEDKGVLGMARGRSGGQSKDGW